MSRLGEGLRTLPSDSHVHTEWSWDAPDGSMEPPGTHLQPRGRSHSLALKSDGTVVAWGGNTEGQTAVPAGLTGVTAIAAHWSHSLALKSDGTVVAWGDSPDGEADVPAGLTDVTTIAAGEEHSVAVGKLRRPDLLIGRAATGPYLGNDLYNTAGPRGRP